MAKTPKNQTPSLDAIIERLKESHPHIIFQPTGESRIRRVQTGVFVVDRVLQGGLPINRLNLIYGVKGAFKTTLMLKTLKNFLDHCSCCFRPEADCPYGNQFPKKAVFLDTERGLDEMLVSRLGIDTDRIWIMKTDYGEQCVAYAKEFARAPEVGAIIVDSLTNFIPRDELDSDPLDSAPWAARAKLIAQLVRALVVHVDTPEPKLCLMAGHSTTDPKTGMDNVVGGKMAKNFSSVVLKVWPRDIGENKIKFDSKHKPETFEEAGDPRVKGIGFLVENSKTSHDNIQGEFDLYVEEDGDKGIGYGMSDDWALVFSLLKIMGMIESAAPYRCNGQTFKTQRDLFHSWLTDEAGYGKLKGDLIEALKSKSGGQR